MSDKENKKSSPFKYRLILLIALTIGIIAGYYGLKFYKIYFAGNVTGKEKYLYVRTGSNLDNLVSEIKQKDILSDPGSFLEAAEKMNLAKSLKPGRYLLTKGMNNRSIVNMLKSGNQDAVMLKFQNLRKKENFAAFLSANLEPDSLTFIRLLDSAALIEKYGFNTDNSYVMFIPNTYEMYWNIKPIDFFERLEQLIFCHAYKQLHENLNIIISPPL